MSVVFCCWLRCGCLLEGRRLTRLFYYRYIPQIYIKEIAKPLLTCMVEGEEIKRYVESGEARGYTATPAATALPTCLLHTLLTHSPRPPSGTSSRGGRTTTCGTTSTLRPSRPSRRSSTSPGSSSGKTLLLLLILLRAARYFHYYYFHYYYYYY